MHPFSRDGGVWQPDRFNDLDLTHLPELLLLSIGASHAFFFGIGQSLSYLVRSRADRQASSKEWPCSAGFRIRVRRAGQQDQVVPHVCEFRL